MFNTPNIKISVDMAIADAGATGHFVLPGTPIKNIKPAGKPLCIKLPYGKQIKYIHTRQIDISWLPEAATRAHIVPGLAHTCLVYISITIICDAGCKVEYDAIKCRVIFNEKLHGKEHEIRLQVYGSSH